MRVTYLQHVPFEGLGSIEPWLLEHGHIITPCHLHVGNALPALDEFELLIIMGGPMSVNDEADYSWLHAEKALVRNAIDAGKAVLGICRGAQMIASAMGASIYANGKKEIGWFPIESIAAEGDTFQFQQSLTVFHWHGETFDLPMGAKRIASSVACQNQAFQIGRSVIGLQFHLETTPESASAIVEQCRDELVDAPYIQQEQQILAQSSEGYQRINEEMGKVLAYLLQK